MQNEQWKFGIAGQENAECSMLNFHFNLNLCAPGALLYARAGR